MNQSGSVSYFDIDYIGLPGNYRGKDILILAKFFSILLAWKHYYGNLSIYKEMVGWVSQIDKQYGIGGPKGRTQIIALIESELRMPKDIRFQGLLDGGYKRLGETLQKIVDAMNSEAVMESTHQLMIYLADSNRLSDSEKDKKFLLGYFKLMIQEVVNETKTKATHVVDLPFGGREKEISLKRSGGTAYTSQL